MGISSFIRRKLLQRKKVHYISNKTQLSELDTELGGLNLFGLDTEFDWRTTYFPKLSMVQISSLKNIFLIDCLLINPSTVLKKHLENKEKLKIFHSARSDATVLSNCIEAQTSNVFDIQMAEKLISNNQIEAYGKIVNKYYGIKLLKSETNSNWLRRPLTKNQMSYAKDDVYYLIEIYKLQRKILKKRNLLNEAFTNSKKEVTYGNKPLKEIRLKRQEKRLSQRNQKIFIWREEIAEAANLPPSFIFKEKYLGKLSKINSKDTSAKKKIMSIIGDSEITQKFIKDFL
tara:strand:- start:1450 stop:2310 length:861 start_codon:yes stop_codon:yes gene_type:complete